MQLNLPVPANRRDALTGLPMFGFAYDAVKALPWASTLLVDVDHLARINHDFGHAVADEILVTMAALLGQQLPDKAFLARSGGDEFVLLALDPFTCLAEVAERMRSDVERQFLDPYRLTVTIGVGDAAALLENKASVLRERVRHGKLAGRNRVMVSELPPEEELRLLEAQMARVRVERSWGFMYSAEDMQHLEDLRRRVLAQQLRSAAGPVNAAPNDPLDT
jgi:diguanylate cyclase (GGDEF)-like protein